MKKRKHRKLPLKVIRISSGKGHCRVSEPFVVVSQTQKVKFQNGTKGRVHVHISDDALFKKAIFMLPKGAAITQPVRSVARGVYPYAVFCEENHDFCTGSSMPIIIVPTEKQV